MSVALPFGAVLFTDFDSDDLASSPYKRRQLVDLIVNVEKVTVKCQFYHVLLFNNIVSS